MRSQSTRALSSLGGLLAAALVGVLLLPVVVLALSSSPQDIVFGLSHPMFGPALGLSLRTTLVSMALTLLMGTPLSWWLATSRGRLARVVAVLVEVPIVIPPAVMGVALLGTFGRRGLLGPALASLGMALPFSEAAVVLAQLVVASPFYVQAATVAFAKVEPDALIVARTLGATPRMAFWRVALPIAWPGLVTGLSLAWARALGEFGATLLFAGNLTGSTQTMPLAILSALEAELRLALVFALALGAIGTLLLAALQWSRRAR